MKRDAYTPDMFEVPTQVNQPGTLSIGQAIRALLSEQLKACELTRFDVAAAMSQLTGTEITKHQLDSWTAESREAWRFPVEYLPAFEVAVGTHAITAFLVDLRGGRLLIGKDALVAELGRLERVRDEAGKRIRALKSRMGEPE